MLCAELCTLRVVGSPSALLMRHGRSLINVPKEEHQRAVEFSQKPSTQMRKRRLSCSDINYSCMSERGGTDSVRCAHNSPGNPVET
jgi:hypothetical protein